MAILEKDNLSRGRRDLLKASFLASRDIYLVHQYFYMEFYFKDKNVLYTISVNVLSSGLHIKDFLQLNMQLLVDESKNILFRNNKINIPQEVSEGQDHRGILIFC